MTIFEIEDKRIEIQDAWIAKLTADGYINPVILIRDSTLHGLSPESVLFTYSGNVGWRNTNMVLIEKNQAAFEYDVRAKVFNEFFKAIV